MRTVFRNLFSTRRRRLVACSLGLSLVAVNAWAFLHARAMTHYVAEGELTARPEKLAGAARFDVLLRGVSIPRPVNRATPDEFGLRFETHRISVAAGAELEAWYIPHEAPRACVLLFHGYASCKARLLPEATALYRLGCAVLLVDFQGSGGSTGSTTTIGVDEALDVARASAFASELARDMPQVLFGRSMGSVAILRAIACEEVRPAGIVLECPFDRLITTIRHRFEALRVPSFPGAELMMFWGSVQLGMNGFAHNPVEYATAVTCPALVLHGEQDQRVSVAECRSVFENLAGPRRMTVFRGVGHEACYRTRPDRWTGEVEVFLDSLAE